MILLWMLSAMLFTLFVAVAAFWAERLLRAVGRPGRGAWVSALAVGTIWPVLVPLLHRLRASSEAAGAASVSLLDAMRIVPERLSGPTLLTPATNRVVVAAWLVVSTVLVVRYAMLWLVVGRIRRRSERAIVDGVEVLVSGDLGPAVVGLRDAAVLLPRAMLKLDAPLRRLVLRHEEEHRRAHDPWVLLGLAVAVAVLPWNLPLWWIARRARLALEVDCDARVMAAGESVTRYMQVLLLAAQRVSAAPLAPMLVASRTHLERRIHAMHSASLRRHPLRIAGAAAACVIAGIAACSSHIADGVTAPKPAATAKMPVKAAQPYFEFQVEKPVQLELALGAPVYPAELKAAKIEGEVLAQFVVDQSGTADVSTFKVLRATNAAFTQAVREALPKMRFTPAEIGGHTVKQLVQQPFTFAMSK